MKTIEYVHKIHHPKQTKIVSAMLSEEDLLFNAIGRFAVAFEMVCDEMRACITSALETNGLKNRELTEVVVADLTAEPLRRLLGAVFAVMWAKDTDAKSKVSKLLKRIQELTSARNRILHGRWDVDDPYYLDDPIVAEGLKIRTSEKDGLIREYMEYSPDDFHKHRREAEEITGLLKTLLVSAFLVETIKDKVDWASSFEYYTDGAVIAFQIATDTSE